MSPRRAKAVQGRVDDDPATALREHLIDAAVRLLATRQLATITTRDIARDAGVSDGVLYNYFADKYELLVAALVRRYGRLAERFDVDLPEPGTGDLEANIVAYAQASLDFHAELIPIVVGLITDADLLRRFLDEIHRQPFGPQHTHQRVRGYLVGEMRAGRIAADLDPDAATLLLLGAGHLLALTNHIVVPDNPTGRTAQLPALARTLLRGLAPG